MKSDINSYLTFSPLQIFKDLFGSSLLRMGNFDRLQPRGPHRKQRGATYFIDQPVAVRIRIGPRNIGWAFHSSRAPLSRQSLGNVKTGRKKAICV